MADKFLKVDIITPQSVIYSGEAVSVNVPGALSPFTVLINHAPIVSSLENGITTIKDTSNITYGYVTSKGFIEVNKNKVSILVESANSALSLDKNQIMAKIEKLKSFIGSSENKKEKDKAKSELEFEQLKLKAAAMQSSN